MDVEERIWYLAACAGVATRAPAGAVRDEPAATVHTVCAAVCRAASAPDGGVQHGQQNQHCSRAEAAGHLLFLFGADALARRLVIGAACAEETRAQVHRHLLYRRGRWRGGGGRGGGLVEHPNAPLLGVQRAQRHPRCRASAASAQRIAFASCCRPLQPALSELPSPPAAEVAAPLVVAAAAAGVAVAAAAAAAAARLLS